MTQSKRPNHNHRVYLCACPHCRADMDAGKRISDALNVYVTGLGLTHWRELRSKWMAFRLSDGTSDGVLYDSKRDAVAHQMNEFQCVYISFANLAGGAKPMDCALFLNFTRDAYDAGFRLPDPDDVNGGRDLAPTAGQMDAARGIIRAALPDMHRFAGAAGLN